MANWWDKTKQFVGNAVTNPWVQGAGLVATGGGAWAATPLVYDWLKGSDTPSNPLNLLGNSPITGTGTEFMGNPTGGGAAGGGNNAAANMSLQALLAQQGLVNNGIAQGYGAANMAGSTLGNAGNQARMDLLGGAQGAAGNLTDYTGRGIDTLRGTAGMGREALQYGAGAAMGQLGGPSALGAMLAQPGGLYGGFQQDPGYQFRQQQGEQAINRSAAARGGRLGGRTLQELSNFNQGLASQEYGNFANRQAQAAGLAGQYDAGQQSLMAQRAGIANQLGQNLAQNYSNLGSQVGNASFGLASQLANLQQGTGQNLANTGVGIAQQQAGLYPQAVGQQNALLAQLLSQYQMPAQIQSGADMAAQQQAAQNRSDLLTALGMVGASALPAVL